MSVQINHHSEETYSAMRAHGVEMEPASSSFVCRVGSVRWITLVQVRQFSNEYDWQASCGEWRGPVAQSPEAALAAAELEDWGGLYVVAFGRVVLLYADGREYITGQTARLHRGRNELEAVDITEPATVTGVRVWSWKANFPYPRVLTMGDTLKLIVDVTVGG